MSMELRNIFGSGGGSGKAGGDDSSGSEASNTLRSNERARLLELISEGPCVGFPDPENIGNSIYLDQTPLVNQDGTVNFKGVQWSYRLGLPDQEDFPGNPQVESGFTVEAEVKASQGPVVRSILEQNATQVRVVVRIPSLTLTNTETGSIGPNSVAYAIEVAANDGAWLVAETVEILNQKCTSPFERATLVDLPAGGYPWQIRVRRVTPDATDLKNQNSTVFASYSVIVGGRFTYPHSAIVFLNINASLYGGSSIPERRFRWRGLIISVPSNYDPITRTYDGLWDGTFKQAWTNNPVWVFYDLVTNDRYGMGEFVDAARIDKWSLYRIAQYCDEQVPDGFGGTETRYTFNGVINTREEAFKVLQNIASTWRGMTYWSLGQIFATADMPEDPVKLVAPANVLGGSIEYSGTAMKARHSVALVQWNDPLDFYRPNIEVVIDDEMLARFGWRETQIQLTGCTTRGMAHRYGRWALDTERYQTESAEYGASFDHMDVRPGNIIAIADPRKAQTRLGGRIRSVDGAGKYTLDQAFTPDDGAAYHLMVENTDGEVLTGQIVSFDGAQVTVSPDFSPPPAANAMWVITGTDIVPRQYRLLAIRENKANEFNVNALFHDPNKYARVEQNIVLDELPYHRPKTTVRTPTNLHAAESLQQRNGVPTNRITLSWSYYPGEINAGYFIEADTPAGYRELGTTKSTAIDIDDADLGNYTFRVYTLGGTPGIRSDPAVLEFEALGWAALDGAYVSHLELFGRGNEKTFGGVDCRVVWRNNFPGTTVQAGQETTGSGQGQHSPFFRDNIIRIYDTSTGDLLRMEAVAVETYTYTFDHNTSDNAVYGRTAQRDLTIEVTIRDNLGKESKPATIAVTNPAPPLVLPNVEGGLDTLFVTYLQPDDLDWKGSLVWLGTTRDFDPLTTEPVYDGPNTALSMHVEPFHTYWIRVAGYDEFGKTDLNISPPVAATVGGVVIDTNAPDVPAGLALTSVIETNASGDVVTVLRASWTAITSDLLAYYEIEVKPAGGNYVSFPTATNSFELRGLRSNVVYTAHVRSVSKNGYPSAFSEEVSTVTATKTTPPGNVTGLAATASLKSAYLSWLNPTDADIDLIEIYQDSTSHMVGSTKGVAFTVSGLVTGESYQFWVRPVNTSGVAGSFTGPVSVTPGQVANGDVAANAITADQITAGAVTTGHFNVNAQLPATITVGTSGVSIGAIQASASNPAAAINANTTLIDPGKILITGGFTLANWRSGSDQTKIDGGNISANSIAANRLQIGSRGLAVSGLDFTPDRNSNLISWSSGSIAYSSDNGSPTIVGISSGGALWTGGTLYIYWTKDFSSLQSTSDYSTVAGNSNAVHIASYQGGSSLQVLRGGTIIDGLRIITGSIQAAQIAAGAITGDKIGANQISAGHLQAGAITADKITVTDVVITNSLQLGNSIISTSKLQNNAITTGTAGTGVGSAYASLTVFPYLAYIMATCSLDDMFRTVYAGSVLSGWSISFFINGTKVASSPLGYFTETTTNGATSSLDYFQQSRTFVWLNTFGEVNNVPLECRLEQTGVSGGIWFGSQACSISALLFKK